MTTSPSLYEDIPCRKVPDLYSAKGPLAGIHSGLSHARCEQIFVTACDMPFISPDVVRQICRQGKRGEVIIPRSEKCLEPLHALYHSEMRSNTLRNALLVGVSFKIEYLKTGKLPDSLPADSPKDAFGEQLFELIKTESGFTLKSKSYDVKKNEQPEYEFKLPKK